MLHTDVSSSQESKLKALWWNYIITRRSLLLLFFHNRNSKTHSSSPMHHALQSMIVREKLGKMLLPSGINQQNRHVYFQ